MGLLDNFKTMLSGGKIDLRQRYEYLREGISGTMSKFYKARDRQTGEIVGLKVVDPAKLAAFEARFKGLTKPSEAEILAKLEHPSIVKMLTSGVSTENEQFLVMEFIDGPGLNSLTIGQSELLNGKRLGVIRQAAEALAVVHAAGFIHRDVCPRNYMATPDLATVKMIDFGLTIPAKPDFMAPGNRTGTPNYMAPELAKRQSTDQRLDVFAFGVTAYELCTFELPWQRGTDGQIAMTHASPMTHSLR